MKTFRDFLQEASDRENLKKVKDNANNNELVKYVRSRKGDYKKYKENFWVDKHEEDMAGGEIVIESIHGDTLAIIIFLKPGFIVLQTDYDKKFNDIEGTLFDPVFKKRVMEFVKEFSIV